MKPQKFVNIRLKSNLLRTSTEKAQLLKVYRNNEPKKFWLPLSLIYLNAPESSEYTVCRMPAWLYYRSGLNEVYTNVGWSSVKIEETPEA